MVSETSGVGIYKQHINGQWSQTTSTWFRLQAGIFLFNVYIHREACFCKMHTLSVKHIFLPCFHCHKSLFNSYRKYSQSLRVAVQHLHYPRNVFLFNVPRREAEDVWCIPLCLKSKGCYLIPLCYLLSCSSVESCCSFCLVLFSFFFLLWCILLTFPPEDSSNFFFLPRDRPFSIALV